MSELFFDGDCGFCRRCIARWRQVAGDQARATPYQQAVEHHPEIPLEQFRSAVQYIDDDGRRWSGAPAIFQSLKHVRGYAWLSWAYSRVPLFAPASDWLYREVAGHRKSATWITRMLWGASLDLPQYQTSVWMFRRILAVLYAIAFASFGVQVRSMIGSRGILPVTAYLDAVRQRTRSSRLLELPRSSGGAEATPRSSGSAGSARRRPSSAPSAFSSGRYLWRCTFCIYRSSPPARFSWDISGISCCSSADFSPYSSPLLAPRVARPLAFVSPCVRVRLRQALSHDPTWANLTALSYHYWTQPIPTPLAWYPAQAPRWFQKLSTAMFFVIESAVPLLIFGPRRTKQIAALAIALPQLLIILTRNYTCFNLLPMSLYLFLLDDQFWGVNNWRFNAASLRWVFGAIPECRSAPSRERFHHRRNTQDACRRYAESQFGQG